jgi:hypothetical protein
MIGGWSVQIWPPDGKMVREEICFESFTAFHAYVVKFKKLKMDGKLAADLPSPASDFEREIISKLGVLLL